MFQCLLASSVEEEFEAVPFLGDLHFLSVRLWDLLAQGPLFNHMSSSLFSLSSFLELGCLIIMCPAAEKGTQLHFSAQLHFCAQHLAVNISFFLSGLINYVVQDEGLSADPPPQRPQSEIILRNVSLFLSAPESFQLLVAGLREPGLTAHPHLDPHSLPWKHCCCALDPLSPCDPGTLRLWFWEFS